MTPPLNATLRRAWRLSLAWISVCTLAACTTPLPRDAGTRPPLLVATKSPSPSAGMHQAWAQTPLSEEAARPAESVTQASTQPRRLTDFEQARRVNTRPATTTNEDVLLNFVEADLQGVVRALARFTGRNFVVDPRIRGQLSLVSEAPVSPDTAYRMLLGALRMQGFAVVDVDGVNRVVPEADAKLQGSPVVQGGHTTPTHGDGIVTRVFTLRYENAANLVAVLRPMVSANNPINAYAANNTLVITDYADNLDRIAQVIASIDAPLSVNTDIIPIEHGVALDVAALANEVLDGRAGAGADPLQRISLVADPRTNSILINARSAARLNLARDLITRIDSPNRRGSNLHVVYLRNAQATRLVDVLRGVLMGQGQPSNSAAAVPAAAATMPRPNAPTNTKTANADSNNLASTFGALNASAARPLGTAFSAAGATIQADPETNTLIISAPEALYRSLREVIDQLDQRRAQVLVESLIVEVTADNAAEFGIQWMAGGHHLEGKRTSFIGGSNLAGSGVGVGSTGATTLDLLGQGLNLGVVRGTVNILGNEVINLGVLARALESKGGVNILSTPNLMTLDNEEASIMVGRTIPFTTGRYVTSGDGTSNPFQTIEREDVGLTLRIRPQISEGGSVKLELYQEVSSVDAAASLSADALTTRKRALQTNVLVDDGQIIVLGGLIEDTISDTTAAVPILGHLPVLGRLFRYDSRTHSKTNLMVFLRPHVIRTAHDSANVTLDRYHYIRAAQARLPIASDWFSPRDEARFTLPTLSLDEDSGLIDLRPLTTELEMTAPPNSAMDSVQPRSPAP